MQALPVLAEASRVKATELNSHKYLLKSSAKNESHLVQCERKKTRQEKEHEYEKLRQLCSFEDAPNHLKFNPFIREGYRKELTTWLCLESVFWWTNETINIWSHLFGWFLFVGLTIADIQFLSAHASFIDKIIVGAILVCFQACLLLSSIYHTFSCRSAKDYDCFLSYDLFGIALSLLAIYISGIFYAFWCHETLRNFYVCSVAVIFLAAMLLQIPMLKIKDTVKMLVFVIWAVYGIIPTCHWYLEMGGAERQMVQLFIPRVAGMYVLTGLAFVFYIARIPERWFTGKFDFFGHSHNLWHLLVLVAFYYWHNSGFSFLEFRLSNGCAPQNVTIY